MAKKQERMSLRDLKRTDDMENSMGKIDDLSNNKNSVSTKPNNNYPINPHIANEVTEDISATSYEKLSVSIPTDLFESLQDISRQRRRAKKKHTMSQMVREALNLWLQHRTQTNSI